MNKTLIIATLILATSYSYAENYFTSPKKPSAKLVLDSQRSTDTLASVSLLGINGENIIPRSQVVWLKPGEYSLKFSSNIKHNSVNTGSNKLRNKRENANHDLDVKLEEGKTYYIAYDSFDKDINKWHPIVWKVE